MTLRFRSPYPSPTKLLLDHTDTRLALVHQGGQVTLWESDRLRQTTPPPANPAWLETVRLEGEAANGLPRPRLPAVTFDGRGGLCWLTLRSVAGKSTRELLLRRLDGTRMTEEVIDPWVGRDPGEAAGLPEVDPRSLALLWDHDRLIGAYRRPERGGAVGRIVLFHRRIGLDGELQNEVAPQSVSEDVEEKSNWGFDTQLFAGREAGRPTILHFSHHSETMMVTSPSEAGWQTRRLGRRGPRVTQSALRASDGAWHWLVRPGRFGGDPAPFVHVQLAKDAQEDDKNTPLPLETAWEVKHARLGLDRQETPVTVYSRRRPDGAWEWIEARREGRSWQRLPILPSLPPGDECSNLLCDREGVLRFASSDGTARQVFLHAGVNGKWETSLLWNAPAEDPQANAYPLFFLLDQEGQPTLLVQGQSAQGQWFRLLRLPRRT